MRLRKQLFFLSLITLTLPWVGFQYVQEMDAALRKGQRDALVATARAVSARISSDIQISNEIRRYMATSDVFYAHVLQSPLTVDGYHEDWTSRALIFNNKASPSGNFDYLLGRSSNTLFVFIRVNKQNIGYFNPADLTLRNTDYIHLSLPDNSHIAVYASAPGQIRALRLNPEKEVTSKFLVHQVKGIWHEWENGFQIELSLPLSWALNGFNINRVDAASPPQEELPPLYPVITLSPQLSEELEIFASNGIRLSLASNQSKRIATAGDIKILTDEEKHHGMLEWLYRLMLQNKEAEPIDTPNASGEFVTRDVRLALQGNEASGWYQYGLHQILRVSIPIAPNAELPIGAVVAEQSADSLANVTNSAFGRLLGYSFLASCAAALCLVIYATWLSFRIKRLSHAAAHAISDSGKVTENFPVSKSEDEIGELSRSFAQLLLRLREYTNYLRTLSSKLSHELRTPLAIVKTSLDNLEHEKLGKQAKVYAERAKEGALRLSNILNSMSAASRVEQAIGAAEMEIIPCDELLRSLKDAYEDVYPHVSFSLRIQEQRGGLKMLGSGELIVQLLDKLVDNAADFCPPNGLVELGLYQHDDIIVFTVRNEGPPLPKHMQNQLFDSMVSVREDATPEEKGHHLGLGLYIVRLIADFHRGEVQGYNVPDNSGVIFEVRFPANT